MQAEPSNPEHGIGSGSAEPLWVLQDWSWNPFDMIARPVDKKSVDETQTQEGSELPQAPPLEAHPTAPTGDGAPSSSGSKSQGGDHARPQPPPDSSDTNNVAVTSGLERVGDTHAAAAEAAKKARPVCQVPGCGTDLSNLKEYHQRYKICSQHMAAREVMEDGRRQRFCQQCGRFHDLTEFDGEKRSCRARLQRHNARRRKKGDDDGMLQPGLAKKQQLLGSHAGLLPVGELGSPGQFNGGMRAGLQNLSGLSRVAGVQIADFSPAARGNSDLSLDQALGELLRDGMMARAAELAAKGQLGGGAGALMSMLTRNEDGGQGGFAGGGNVAGSAWRNNTEADALLRSQLSQLDGLRLQEAARGRAAADVLAANLLAGRGSGGAAAGGAAAAYRPAGASTLDFARGLQGGAAGGPSSVAAGSAVEELLMAVQAQQQAGSAAGQQPAGAAAGSATLQQQAANLQSLLQQQQQRSGGGPGAAASGPNASSTILQAALQNGMLGDAVSLLQARSQSRYANDERLTRISAKLFRCTPAQLPAELKDNLMELLRCSPGKLDACLRQGCVHLTLNARLQLDKAVQLHQLGVRTAVERLLASADGELWSTKPMLVQLHDEVAVVRGARVEHVVSLKGSRGVYPQVVDVSPIAVLASAADTITLRGYNLCEPHNKLLCRHAGRDVPLRVVDHYEELDEGGADGSVAEECSEGGSGVWEGCGWLDVVEVDVCDGLAGVGQGALQVEVLRGALLSTPQTVLALDDPGAVQQLRELEGAEGVDVGALLADIGMVVEALDTLALRDALEADPRAQADTPMRQYNDEELASVANTATRVVAFACERGWDSVAKMLLPGVLLAGWSKAQVLRTLDNACGAGVGLLHVCLRAPQRVTETVCAVLEWAADAHVPLYAAAPGANGLTPLHLAALLCESDTALTLARLAADGAAGWTTARSAAGATPADFAQACGFDPEACVVLAQAAEHVTPSDAAPLPKQATADEAMPAAPVPTPKAVDAPAGAASAPPALKAAVCALEATCSCCADGNTSRSSACSWAGGFAPAGRACEASGGKAGSACAQDASKLAGSSGSASAHERCSVDDDVCDRVTAKGERPSPAGMRRFAVPVLGGTAAVLGAGALSFAGCATLGLRRWMDSAAC